MADKYFVCIIGEMDRLWFHQVILFSEPTPSVTQDPIKQSVPLSSPPSSILSFPDEETSTDETPSPQKQVSSESIAVSPQDDPINYKEEKKDRLARTNALGSRIRSHSSSPSAQHSHAKFRKHATTTTRSRKLHKSMSCRTLGELELDEVKGFIDLGFTFKRETLNPRMMSVVPGLQRLGLQQNKQHTQVPIGATETVQDSDIEAEKKRDIVRPYLSEAWLIKRPDSPLLNLRIPKPCSASTMKKHLRYWAKTVASEIHQE